jgi:hypothetical protein
MKMPILLVTILVIFITISGCSTQTKPVVQQTSATTSLPTTQITFTVTKSSFEIERDLFDEARHKGYDLLYGNGGTVNRTTAKLAAEYYREALTHAQNWPGSKYEILAIEADIALADELSKSNPNQNYVDQKRKEARDYRWKAYEEYVSQINNSIAELEKVNKASGKN